MVGATPFGGRAPIPAPQETEPLPPETTPVPAPARTMPAPGRRRGAALDPDRPVGLDRRTWLRLKRGQIVVEQVLDLHGQSQEEAHQRLENFLAAAHGAGRRCVLIVTGKGEMSGGVLRHMVPRWLNEGGNRERLVSYCTAQRRHGGAGALYVLLRSRR